MDPGSIPLVCGPQGFNTRRTWHEKGGKMLQLLYGQHRNHISYIILTSEDKAAMWKEYYPKLQYTKVTLHCLMRHYFHTTTSMEQSHWKVNCCSTTEESPSLSWYLKVHLPCSQLPTTDICPKPN
jgi:hypothetical protein